jgi:uncharacterized membrane-anchored protein YjiN (DUF445 family)
MKPKLTFKSTFGKPFGVVARKKGIIRVNKRLSKLKIEPKSKIIKRDLVRNKRQALILERKLNEILIKNKKEYIPELINKLIKEKNQGKENKFINEFVHSHILEATREYIKTARPKIDGVDYLTASDINAIIKRIIRKI